MLKLNRLAHEYLVEIGKQTIKEGDSIEIIPVRGRKKTFALNRARYEIVLDPEIQEVVRKNEKIIIPGGRQNCMKIELVLYENETCSAYFLRNTSRNFFILNGRVISESFLRSNDILSLEFNRIKFITSDSYNKKGEAILVDPRFIKSNYSIILQGETGTGKTTLAKKIHEKSNVVGSFVHLNLSSFSSSLIESELFGHKKGAFTGASIDKRGAILEAHNGTLFLDEIDSISLELQTKLLTFLDNGEFRVVGGGQKKAKVRLIYSSGKCLKRLVSDRRMRLDFYYRLMSSHFIQVPSLRENKEYCKNIIEDILSKDGFSINPKLMNWYLECPWPGNIRQLKSHLFKKMFGNKLKYLKFDQLDINLKSDNFPIGIMPPEGELIKLAALKKTYIEHALMINNGDFKRTSQQIGVSENTIRRTV